MDYSFTSYSQLPLFLNAEQVAALLGISRAGAYTLLHKEGCPCIRINKRMLVERDKLMVWLEEQSHT